MIEAVAVAADTWGHWTDNFQTALSAWREHGGAMLCDTVAETKWLAYDADEIAEMTRDGDQPADPKACTIAALEAGGMTPEQIEAEMRDWQD